MEVKTKTRQSNFELMKIVSMLFILIWHFTSNTNLITDTDGFLHFVLLVIWFVAIIHVNSFIISLGYFQNNKRFKLSRVIAFNNSAWFYKILFLIVFLILGTSLTSVDIFKLLSPITLYEQYWFLSVYIILYLLSPFLNIIIDKISKKQFYLLLLTLFLLTSIIPTITGQLAYNNSQGHSVFSFVFLYFIGAYLSRYPIDKNYFFKVTPNNTRKLIFIFLFFFIALFNSLLCHYGEELIDSTSTFLRWIGDILVSSRLGFDNPLVIIQTICYFLFFSSLDIKSKVINKIASLSFGVYLIHDNILLRPKLYNAFYDIYYSSSFFAILGRIFVFSIVIFIVCILIEWLRQIIFKFFSRRKIAKKLREKLLRCFKSINLNVNW